MSNSGLEQLILQAWPELSLEQRRQVSQFHRLLLEENELQNLTKLTSPKDFVEGHLVDVKELFRSRLVEYPAMDLGSGCGVPGLLAAVLGEGEWILAESETRKAEYLARAADGLLLSKRVKVFSGRAEAFLSKCGAQSAPASIVARAVGPVSRIYGWIRPCSTWNKLILLKGPRWEEEWQDFLKEQGANHLKLLATHEYSVGAENKKRIIVQLGRVPRGTKMDRH